MLNKPIKKNRGRDFLGKKEKTKKGTGIFGDCPFQSLYYRMIGTVPFVTVPFLPF
jgi:hypothetical protein